jgi:hypothetical protein
VPYSVIKGIERDSLQIQLGSGGCVRNRRQETERVSDRDKLSEWHRKRDRTERKQGRKRRQSRSYGTEAKAVKERSQEEQEKTVEKNE